MDGKMTLEQVRDWHLERSREYTMRNGANHNVALAARHRELADAIDAHLTQPAQSVDVGAIKQVILQLRAYQNLHEKFPEAFPDMELGEEADKLTAALPEKGNG